MYTAAKAELLGYRLHPQMHYLSALMCRMPPQRFQAVLPLPHPPERDISARGVLKSPLKRRHRSHLPGFRQRLRQPASQSRQHLRQPASRSRQHLRQPACRLTKSYHPQSGPILVCSPPLLRSWKHFQCCFPCRKHFRHSLRLVFPLRSDLPLRLVLQLRTGLPLQSGFPLRSGLPLQSGFPLRSGLPRSHLHQQAEDCPSEEASVP